MKLSSTGPFFFQSRNSSRKNRKINTKKCCTMSKSSIIICTQKYNTLHTSEAVSTLCDLTYHTLCISLSLPFHTLHKSFSNCIASDHFQTLLPQNANNLVQDRNKRTHSTHNDKNSTTYVKFMVAGLQGNRDYSQNLEVFSERSK